MNSSAAIREPQAALEQAVVDLLRAQLSLAERDCARTFDDRPHPRAGGVFYAVWSGGGHEAGRGLGTSLDRLFEVNLTITVRCSLPFDRWLEHRDDLESRLDAVVARVNADRTTFAIVNQANTLAGYRPSNPAGPRTVGFCEGLRWERTEDVQEVGPDWFGAHGAKSQGLAQTARFGHARHVQSSTGAR